jgi:two-component system sensor histidine kinase SenX3
MAITSRRGATIFFSLLGVCLVGLTVALNISWIILNWRAGLLLFFGIVFFGLIIVGMVVNTIFLIREIRRNEQQDSFLNAITHELKTPIASIRLYLQTMQQRKIDGEKAQEFYSVMLADTDRLMSTVEQVLKASQLGQKRELQNKLEIDLGALAQECVELVRTRYHQPVDAIRYHPPASPEAALIMGDPEDLRIAITNVLDNAAKYSGNQIDIDVDLETYNPVQVELRIRDRGIGIPRSDLSRVFKRFYRVSTRSQVKGTGLGLFIVRAIVKKHGGNIVAESAGEGKGTTVTLQIPRMYTS